jgi:hypothetical protein
LAPQPIHLVIGTPCYGGQITVTNFSAAIRLRDYCAKNGIRITFSMPWGDALVTRARQTIAAYFMADPTATHLLYIDADISYEVDQVLRLLQFDKDICAGIYPLKRYDWDLVQRRVLAGEGQLESAGLSYVVDLNRSFQPVNGFGKVQETGTGFLMIKRSVFTAMAKKYPELRYQLDGSEKLEAYALFNCLIDEKGTYLSEDYSFCKRWTDMGGEIWVDLNSRLNHLGPEMFKGNVARNFVQAPQEKP